MAEVTPSPVKTPTKPPPAACSGFNFIACFLAKLSGIVGWILAIVFGIKAHSRGGDDDDDGHCDSRGRAQ